MAGTDYDRVEGMFTYTETDRTFYITIGIRDNAVHDGDRRFRLHFHEMNGCIPDEWVDICILDDDEWGKPVNLVGYPCVA